MKKGVVGAVACCLFLGATSLQALTPEAECQFMRAKAKGKYEKCVQNWLATCYATSGLGQCGTVELIQKLSKCGKKYAAAWPKLQALAGTSCDTERFVDNEDGTVTDNLTGLVWETKDDADGIHDKDNYYTWNTGASPGVENGSAFTDLLSSLNAGGGFAGSNGWRLPTVTELMTILLGPYPCGTDPCIDSIFGPTQSDDYWTATTLSGNPDNAMTVNFGFGGFADSSDKTGDYPVRAVRAGF